MQAALTFKELQVDIDPLDKLPVTMMISGLSRSGIYALIASNKFPKPVKLGRASARLRSEVLAWVNARIVERDEKMEKTESSGGSHEN